MISALITAIAYLDWVSAILSVPRHANGCIELLTCIRSEEKAFEIAGGDFDRAKL